MRYVALQKAWNENIPRNASKTWKLCSLLPASLSLAHRRLRAYTFKLQHFWYVIAKVVLTADVLCKVFEGPSVAGHFVDQL